MKWLQDNPLGIALVTISAVFVLFALGMTVVWNLPVAQEMAVTEALETVNGDTVLAAHQVAAISEFQVINQKPVFNVSRQPVVEDADAGEAVVDLSVAVKDAPDVRLTGVIITPSMRIASLTPANEKLESVMAHEGQGLTGEFVGWQVSTVSPRTVVLESRDGQRLDLELQVHDVKIKQPPKPVAATSAARHEQGQAGQTLDENGLPLSRAEQIRQRIAERREELRLEQEAQQPQSGARANNAAKAAAPPTYESAIRNLMRNNRKDKSSDDKQDG